jgi:hypothetical protein
MILAANRPVKHNAPEPMRSTRSLLLSGVAGEQYFALTLASRPM